ncbi:DNA-3-methyladenine glycosylase [Streptomyces adustus]
MIATPDRTPPGRDSFDRPVPEAAPDPLGSFLARPAEEVAPELLGAVLTHETSGGTVRIAITETEAYSGAADPASHAYRGRTPRNAVMFGPAGHLYVYRSHGLHWCANIVTGTEGDASAVLIRAGRVVEGEDLARRRRGAKVETARLARGPGNFCQALGITAEHNGADLLRGASVALSEGEPVPAALVRIGPRVGVSKAHDWQHRFFLADDPTVSAYRLSPRAKPSGAA